MQSYLSEVNLEFSQFPFRVGFSWRNKHFSRRVGAEGMLRSLEDMGSISSSSYQNIYKVDILQLPYLTSSIKRRYCGDKAGKLTSCVLRQDTYTLYKDHFAVSWPSRHGYFANKWQTVNWTRTMNTERIGWLGKLKDENWKLWFWWKSMFPESVRLMI